MKRKVILTVAFLISLTPMLFSQYGGMRGVQEISGLINLTSPIGILALVAFVVGVWVPFDNKKVGWTIGLIGTIGIVLAELYNYFTWHVLTITGEISLTHSINLAFPEFYLGLLVSTIMIGVYVIISRRKMV